MKHSLPPFINITHWVKIFTMRIILFSGKGGVGKTTVAAATGVKLAEMGYRTIVISLDPAHSLSDSFGIPEEERLSFKGLPTNIDKNLWIQEIDIQEDIERHWGDVYRFLELLFNTTGFEDIVAEELAILPGMEEITSLLYINQYYKEGNFDVLILDMPPTGETLRFLSMPNIMKWYMKKIFNTERLLMKVARPIARRFTDVPLPDDSYFKAVENFYTKLEGVDEILFNPDISSVRIVLNPEKMVLEESKRAFMYFNMFGINVDCIILNKIFKTDHSEVSKIQKKYIEEIMSTFSPIPIIKSPYFTEEMIGKSKLKHIAEILYRDKNPADIFFKEQVYSFIKEEGGYKVKLKLPFAPKEHINLLKSGDTIIVRYGNFKSYVTLPRKLINLRPVSAKRTGNYLIIKLE